ncbi:hypothetical protein ABIC09_001516 [Bradyrhizobium sp. S3.12.5]|uniref:Uncharacterized protein n=1 Tax=Bradyrhizobium cytisi TaxID=515489 RepID=A0A5S4W5V1_9BRAD|nr:hypothetical protein FXB38_30975 [Bradyrhizobium cytisi]
MLQSPEGPHSLLRAWQLALLRLAVTRDESDRLNVVALAAELDCLGGESLHFFRRTSWQLCAALRGQLQDAEATLECFCRQIEEPRLRLAFAAAIGMPHSNHAPSRAPSKRNSDLFRGLPARGTASL